MLFSMLPLQHPTVLYQSPIFLIYMLSPCVLAGDRAWQVPAQGLHLGHRLPSRDISPIAQMLFQKWLACWEAGYQLHLTCGDPALPCCADGAWDPDQARSIACELRSPGLVVHHQPAATPIPWARWWQAKSRAILSPSLWKSLIRSIVFTVCLALGNCTYICLGGCSRAGSRTVVISPKGFWF